VLKYAQALYGADAKAVEAMDLDASRLPPPGRYEAVWDPPGVAAGLVLFIGVAGLRDFGFADVRDFGRRALSAVASERPSARSVGLTIHGAGFGLDEQEAFDAELAGILDAIRDRDVPRGLQRIAVAEMSPGRAARLRSRLQDVLPGAAIAPAESLLDAGRRSDRREHALVAMPFAEEFDDLFHYGISNAVRSAGLLCERIDQQAFTGEVMSRLKQQIETSRLVVADLTDSNPNVFLEVGYAWGRGVPTVLMARKGSELKFDVQGQRCLTYSGIKQAEELLTQELCGLVT
jgi:hypothetical protein